MTPRMFHALKQMWRHERHFQMALHGAEPKQQTHIPRELKGKVRSIASDIESQKSLMAATMEAASAMMSQRPAHETAADDPAKSRWAELLALKKQKAG